MAKTRGKNPSSPVLRVRELYAFDEQIRSSVASGLMPDVEGLVPDGNGIGVCSVGLHARRSRTSQERCDATKTMEIAGFDEAGRGALAGPVVVCCVHIPVASGFMPDGNSVAAGGVINTKRNITPPKGYLPDGIETCGVGLHARRGTSILDFLAGLDDSKRVSVKKREALFPRITSVSDWGIGYAAPSEIDRVGIVPALTLAACRAYRAMRYPVDLLLLDRGLSLLSDLTSVELSDLVSERLNHLQPRTPNHPISQSSDHSITQSHDFPLSRSSNPPITQSLNFSISHPPALSFTKGDSRSLHIAAASILAKVYRDRMMVKLNAQYPGYGLDRNKGYGTAAHLAALKRLGPSSIHRRSFKVKQ